MAVLTFGVPVFNGGRFLPESLRSVCEQDLEDIEIILSDNGSTDETEEICRAVAAGDPRVTYLRSDTNRGGTWNYMRAARAGTAPLFTWTAADDIKLPGFASACVDGLRRSPEAVLAMTRTRIIDSAGVVIEQLNDEALGLDAPSAHERVGNLYRTQAAHVLYGVVRRDALLRTRGLVPSVGDDMALLTELLCQGPAVVVPTQGFLQRRMPSQLSTQGAEQVKWHSPGARTRFAFPQVRSNLDMYRAVAASSLPTPEKARCWTQVTTARVVPRWRAMARDVATALGVPAR